MKLSDIYYDMATKDKNSRIAYVVWGEDTYARETFKVDTYKVALFL